jgi:chromate reductase, NAD(P)H dehydrogenase (quinone)
MSNHVRILGIAGSLRRGSYNQAALRAAKLLVPKNSEIDIFKLDDIPMFNEDEEKRPPASVLELKNRIRRADALLIVTPEYNYSVPGVLKNAIDFACRPYGESAWSGKAAAIMGASLGAIGTARAQHHLRQILVALNLFTVNQPEVAIADAAHRFDENGNLIHEPTKQLIQELLKNLVDWTRRISPAPALEATRVNSYDLTTSDHAGGSR